MPSKANKSRHMPGSLAPVYQLKMPLKGTKPPVWRRVLMPAEFDLDEVNATLKASIKF